MTLFDISMAHVEQLSTEVILMVTSQVQFAKKSYYISGYINNNQNTEDQRHFSMIRIEIFRNEKKIRAGLSAFSS